MKKTTLFISHILTKRKKGNPRGRRTAMTLLLLPAAAMLLIPLLSAFSAFADGEDFSYQITSVSPTSGSVHYNQHFDIMYGEPLVLDVSASQSCKLEIIMLGFASRNISRQITKISDTQYRVTFSPDENVNYEGDNAAYLYFSDADDNLFANFKLSLKAKAFEVRSITINKHSIKLRVGESYPLQAVTDPVSAPPEVNMHIEWESDNPGIAEVSADGVLTAKALGHATIYAFAHPNLLLLHDICGVDVVESIPAESVAIGYVEGSGGGFADGVLTLGEAEHASLTAELIPENASDTVQWESSDPGVAAVDSSGGITAGSMGNATVTVRAGEQTDSVVVRVLRHVASVSADCTNDGNKEHWQDKDGNAYSSSKGTSRISDIRIPALGHNWGAWEVTTPATCEEAGEETRTCTRDASHKETREIAALGHNWGEWTVTKEATETEAGEEERVCQNDPSHKETRKISAQPDDYSFTDDSTFKWKKGSKDGLLMEIENISNPADDPATFEKLVAVYVDGNKLTPHTDYTAEAGSIRLTLLPGYLNKLSNGEHTLKVVLTVTTIKHTFTVTAPASTDAPSTGENGLTIAVSFVLLACALAGCAFSFLRKRKAQT